MSLLDNLLGIRALEQAFIQSFLEENFKDPVYNYLALTEENRLQRVGLDRRIVAPPISQLIAWRKVLNPIKWIGFVVRFLTFLLIDITTFLLKTLINITELFVKNTLKFTGLLFYPLIKGWQKTKDGDADTLFGRLKAYVKSIDGFIEHTFFSFIRSRLLSTLEFFLSLPLSLLDAFLFQPVNTLRSTINYFFENPAKSKPWKKTIRHWERWTAIILATLIATLLILLTVYSGGTLPAALLFLKPLVALLTPAVTALASGLGMLATKIILSVTFTYIACQMAILANTYYLSDLCSRPYHRYILPLYSFLAKKMQSLLVAKKPKSDEISAPKLAAPSEQTTVETHPINIQNETSREYFGAPANSGVVEVDALNKMSAVDKLFWGFRKTLGWHPSNGWKPEAKAASGVRLELKDLSPDEIMAKFDVPRDSEPQQAVPQDRNPAKIKNPSERDLRDLAQQDGDLHISIK